MTEVRVLTFTAALKEVPDWTKPFMIELYGV